MSENTISVDGLVKHYGDTEALRGINFDVDSGEVVGFIGPNGAGKTTTMKILTCYTAATEGRAAVAGFDVDQQPQSVRSAIGYLPENVPLYEEMLVFDYLDFITGIHRIDRGERRSRIRETAEMTGVTEVLGQPIHQLSKGFRQRVGLAQAIIHRPEVVILDEPTTGLDPNQIIEIRDVITTIGEQNTVLLSTHILQEISAVCDRIIILDEGLIVADGSVEELRDEIDTPEADLEEIFRHYTVELKQNEPDEVERSTTDDP